MKQITQRIILIMSFTFVITNILHGQTNILYSQIQTQKIPSPKYGKLKTILSPDYKIIGYIYRKHFLENEKITILSLKTQDTIISGRYFVNNNNGYINGIWKRYSNKRVTHADGLFKVSNSNNKIGLTTKPRRAGPLLIKTKEVFCYHGFRNKYPAILEKLQDGNYLLEVNYDDKSRYENNDIIKVELNVDKKLIKKYGYYSIDDFIYYSPKEKCTYANGDIFIGKMKNISIDSSSLFKAIPEQGKMLYAAGDIVFEDLTKTSDSTFLLKIKYSDKQKVKYLDEMELIISKNLIDKYGYWDINEFIYNTHQVKLIYKNGDIFIGKTENSRDSSNIAQKLTIGEYQFSTGEVFQGDISGERRRGIPVSGTMKFTDGSIEKGDWVSKYYISQDVWDKQVAPLKNLTEEHSLTIRLHKARIARQQQRFEEFAFRKRVIAKYGQHWGNLIAKGKFTLGMTEKMVSEFASPKYFRISKAMYGHVLVETWVFDQQKMETEILDEKGEEGAKAIMGLSLMESLGFNIESETPTLIFTNGKLTGIYYY